MTKRPFAPITRAKIDELLAYLPIFSRPGYQCYEESVKKEANAPPAIYKKEVLAFMKLLNQPCWCDHDYVPHLASDMLRDSKIIKNASLAEIKTMLTCAWRGERFCDGCFGGLIDQGKITAILNRLKELRASVD